MTDPRILVVEGDTKDSRAALVAAGGHVTADLYVETLRTCLPGIPFRPYWRPSSFACSPHPAASRPGPRER